MRTCLRKIGILAATILFAVLCTVGCNTEIDDSCSVEVTAGAHGTVSAVPAIPANGKVALGTVITFTAAPESNYGVEKWTITGGTFEAGTGTEGNTIAKVKITAKTKVNVSFELYTTVPFTNLNAYLQAASSSDIHHIKVTGLTAANLKGDYSNPSALGYILNNNPTKKVALKLEEIPDLTDMLHCFRGCESLTQALIPNGVTNMCGCFRGCKSLTQAPVIPSSVTYMSSCFEYCTSLTQAPVIPNGVTDMSYCFLDCESLTQAPVIPNGVTNMDHCFQSCKSLTQAPVIPSSVTYMSSCFSGCYRLTQAPVIPNGVTDMSSCFSYCKSLTQAPVIPNSVTDMSWCFFDCQSLTQAPVIPNSVTNMQICFEGCSVLTAVTLQCNYNSAIINGKYAFYDAFTRCTVDTIKVPAGQLQTYKNNAATMGTEADRFVAE